MYHIAPTSPRVPLVTENSQKESKVMSLLLNMLSKLVITFLPRSKCLLISWQIDGETVDTVADFIFLGSKITADGDYSHEIERRYSLEGKL